MGNSGSIFSKMLLRIAVRSQMRKWGIGSNLDCSPLYQLFGFDNYQGFSRAHDAGDPELDRNLKLLCGPNGYCVYKMLEAKMK